MRISDWSSDVCSSDLVCPSADGRTCRSDEVWSDGWIVYQDPGRDPQPQDSGTVIQRFEGVGGELQLRSTSGRSRVRFLPAGWAYGSNLSIRLCRPGNDGFLGSVIVNNAGRPRTERQPGGTPCPFLAPPRVPEIGREPGGE